MTLNLKRTENDINRIERQGINDNWKKIENNFNNVVQIVSGDAFDKVVDSAKLIWQPPVNTFADLTTTYPDAQVGWAAWAREVVDGVSKAYRFDGTEWVEQQQFLGDAINEVDNRLSGQLSQAEEQIKNLAVSIDDFGTVGDGVTDDTQAIISAFNYAKNKNVSLFTEKESYFLKSPDEIKIYNSVDFRNSKFIVDDSLGSDKAVFSVEHDTDRYYLDSSTITSLGNVFIKSTRRIPELAGLGDIILYITDDTTIVSLRERKTVGEVQQDQITLDNEGYITTNLSYDFTNVSSIQVQKIDDSFVTISNLNFVNTNENIVTSTQTYVHKYLRLNRSNVILENVNHRVLNEGTGNIQPRAGALSLYKCANLILRNVNLQPLKTRTEGTYEIGGSYVINLTMDNVNGQSYDIADRWGVIGLNYIKNWRVENSSLNRIDCHSGLHNLTIDNCYIGTNGISVVGSGKLSVLNSEVVSNSIVLLRGDYGAYWDGDIVIQNIAWRPKNSTTATAIIEAVTRYDWDYKTDLMMARSLILIENITYNQSDYNSSATPYVMRVESNSAYTGVVLNSYKLPKDIVVRNLKITKKAVATPTAGFALFNTTTFANLRGSSSVIISPEKNIFSPNVRISLDNVEFTYITGATSSSLFSNLTQLGFDGSDDYTSVLNRVFLKLLVNNCDESNLSVQGLPVIVNVNNSLVISSVNNRNGCRSFSAFSNCILKPTVSTGSQQAFIFEKGKIQFTNCRFMRAYYSKYASGNPVSANYLLMSTWYEFMKFAVLGQTLKIEADMSSCTLDEGYRTIRGDINATGFIFGNNSATQLFPLKYGLTIYRPPASDIAIGFSYFDTTLGYQIFWKGSNWVNSVGTNV